jgi:hypothetical protein
MYITVYESQIPSYSMQYDSMSHGVLLDVYRFREGALACRGSLT